ncbi:MAG: Bcr/CflA family multidrug efflux MFS transporter [Alphaproteobacteria bacterium]|nr:Bcr/CflA family multidrug efflux MFS transporter [Alphaproteobacteria bacterium]
MSPARLALILGALTAFTPLSVDMYLPGLPALALQFKAGHGAVQLTLSSFFAGIALGQLFYGPICDRYGRKPPLYVGGLLFVLASAGCALAGSIESLIAMRFVQALGCCAGMVMPRAMVRDLFDPHQAARMFSMLMLVMGVAPILAPLIGGYVLIWSGWPAIFWGLAGYAILVLTAAHFLPETHRPREPVTLSIGSALRGYAAVLVDRQFMGYALAGALPIAGMFAYIAGSPFVFIELYGVPAEKFGWLFGANAAGFIAASQINARLLRHYPPDRILAVASWVGAAAGLLLLAIVLTGAGGLWGVAIGLFACIAPMGMVMPNAAACALAGHGARAGTASAVLGILQFGGGGLTSAAIGAMAATSAVPMGAIVAACVVAAALLRYLLVGPSSPARQ